MRDDLKGRNLTFTEIAKLVGENWQNLSPEEKEPFETQAQTDKDKYNRDLGDYKKTSNYKKYMVYLQEFKQKHTQSQGSHPSFYPPSAPSPFFRLCFIPMVRWQTILASYINTWLIYRERRPETRQAIRGCWWKSSRDKYNTKPAQVEQEWHRQ